MTLSLDEGEMLDFTDYCLHNGLTEINYMNGQENITFTGTMCYQYYNFIEVPPAPLVPDTAVLAFDLDLDDWRLLPRGKVLSVELKKQIMYSTNKDFLNLINEDDEYGRLI